MAKNNKLEKYETLRDLLVLKLCALYDIENQLVKALPKMAKIAKDQKLQSAFTAHLEETKGHVERLEEAAELLDFAIKPEKVEGIRGIIKDADWIMKSIKNPAARDTLLVAAAQYAEHYEMAGYGAARTWAEEMGHNDVADLLQETLNEEGEANRKLTELAIHRVNEKANDMPVGGSEWMVHVGTLARH